MNTNSKNVKGFTLVELLVASGISSMIVLALVTSFLQQRRAYKNIQQISEMDQNVRMAMEVISHQVRNAGYGCSFPASATASWINWGPTMTNYVTVQQGSGSAPDTLRVVGAFDAQLGTLDVAATSGIASVTLQDGQTANFNTSNKKVIFIGRSETARITSIAGNTLSISTDPAVAGVGLKYSYSAGAPVELVKVVTYSWANDVNTYPYTPHLRRDENIGAYSYDWQKMMAGNIEDFQVVPNAKGASVTVRGRTARQDYKFWNAAYGDRYRRRSLTAEFRMRRPDGS